MTLDFLTFDFPTFDSLIPIMKIRIQFSGRGYDMSSKLDDELTLPDGATVNDAISRVAQQLGDQPLPASCLVALSGDHLGALSNYENRRLSEGDELTLIAPVAGG